MMLLEARLVDPRPLIRRGDPDRFQTRMPDLGLSILVFPSL